MQALVDRLVVSRLAAPPRKPAPAKLHSSGREGKGLMTSGKPPREGVPLNLLSLAAGRLFRWDSDWNALARLLLRCPCCLEPGLGGSAGCRVPSRRAETSAGAVHLTKKERPRVRLELFGHGTPSERGRLNVRVTRVDCVLYLAVCTEARRRNALVDNNCVFNGLS